ncbi:hypothetical protein DICA3_F28238 [Diutina catenulata]
MDFHWYQCPVALRFSGEATYAVSGVRLTQINQETGVVACDLIVSLAHFDPATVPRCTVTSTRQQIAKSVNWFPAVVVERVPLKRDFRLFSYLQFFKNSGFLLNPADTLCDNYDAVSVIVVKTHQAMPAFSRTQVQFGTPVVGDAYTMHSFPFNYTNSLLFGDFVSRGTINYVLQQKNPSAGGPPIPPTGYFVDSKYLENTIGAPINATVNDDAAPEDSVVSYGLVLGSFCKANGDGELGFVISWHSLLSLIARGKTPLGLPAGPAPTVNPGPPSAVEMSIMAMVVDDGTARWGSCVHYMPGVLATNQHVIANYVSGGKATVLGTDFSFELGHEDQVVTPHAEIDLSFVMLSQKNRSIIAKQASIKHGHAVEKGDEVYSVGYGLFLDTDNIRPVVSWGCVKGVLAVDGLPSIMVTSASCWNGSSGGGLFTAGTNSFVGLISSNAEVNAPVWAETPTGINRKLLAEQKVEKLPQFSLVIPAALVAHCWRAVVGNKQVKISQDTVDLWKLVPNHEDVVVGESGPKL